MRSVSAGDHLAVEVAAPTFRANGFFPNCCASAKFPNQSEKAAHVIVARNAAFEPSVRAGQTVEILEERG
jgi:hypothetical protein